MTLRSLVIDWKTIRPVLLVGWLSNYYMDGLAAKI